MSPANEITSVIVDDSARMRETIRYILESLDGCSIIGEASDGLEALELARSLRPSIVIMDIHMPNMGGLEALGLMKTELPSIQVVLVSTALDPGVRDEALNLGAMACLEKGAELWNELKRAVSQLSPCG